MMLCGKSKKDDPRSFGCGTFLKIFFWYKEINFIAQNKIDDKL